MRRGLIASCLLVLVSVVGMVGVRASTAEIGTSGVWSVGANLMTGREEHTATLLKTGTVLVTGGTDGRGKALASAELYDPKSNRWMSAGTMASTRLGHTATLLPNGKVLVAGGLDESFPSSSMPDSTELYDPNTNTWSAAASMNTARVRHTATGLLDGRVLVVGGQSFTLRDGGLFPNPVLGAEVYDPVANHWSATAPMLQNRDGHSATLLRDGRVLVAGGGDGFTPSSSAEIYDPNKDRWTAAASMMTNRQGHTATLLLSGNVLVTGGVTSGLQTLATVAPPSAEVYDPQANRWSTIASMAGPRDEYTATLLSNGRLLVVGGIGQSRAEVYDPARNVWSTASATMNRYLHTATRLPDGRILVVGGYGLESLDSALLYDPSATAPVPRAPTNPLVVAGLLFAAFVVLAAVALSFPGVRRRLRGWRASGRSEEWIS
jgi:N-acetylneuraminic acid mutarotase